MSTLAVGIDIGGTGIKGALVDVSAGELASERVKVPTPEGGDPDAVLDAVAEMVDGLGEEASGLPVGVCFPAIVRHGRTLSAANVSDRWIGLEAEALFEKKLGRGIHFVNDADAAGVAEVRFGAARDTDGLVIMTTLGTGIGSAFLHDGVLIPNSELGHLEIDGTDAEHRASYAAKEREELDWPDWAARLQRFYGHVEYLFSPELLIVGGGVSKHHEEFLPLLDIQTPIVPAVLRNNAGILGAAWLAARH
ncbi:polyphosphate--glucose phosphotransferase [Homoserinibacter sp. GY 40078]|uniref:polyphosphate--glucose phosphotransferase n=1 Tax=Homoserinibacter sp. GY 40078 TaxID=2603275 RepID=UPI0011CB84FD|nr:ROK family protein [Homoserinibacter sp. GY 40078]TXK17454.1 ROK family protein [Homoserinibacter sp. GY 40078]